MENHRFRKGFTLMEALIVIAIIGILLTFSIVAFSRYMQQSRLNSTTRKVAQAVMMTRMKAVSTNMDYTFHMDASVTPNTYQISGTNDTNGNSTLDPWEDVNGSGTIFTDKVFNSPQSLELPAVDHQGISTFPLGLNSGQVLNNGATLDLVFNGKGVPKNGAPTIQCIVLQYTTHTQAVTFDATGRVRLWKYDMGWTEIEQ